MHFANNLIGSETAPTMNASRDNTSDEKVGRFTSRLLLPLQLTCSGERLRSYVAWGSGYWR